MSREELIIALQNISNGYDCTCEDVNEGVMWADDATEEETACPSCYAQMVLERLPDIPGNEV